MNEGSGIQVLGVSKPGEELAGPVGVNPVVVSLATAGLPRRLSSSDVRSMVAPPLLLVVADIKDLRNNAIADEVVTRDLVALENALYVILARFDVPGPGGSESGRSLSKREIQVLSQVAAGLSDKEIARRLAISHRTVRNHLSHIFTKLHVSNRTEAVMNALRWGLV